MSLAGAMASIGPSRAAPSSGSLATSQRRTSRLLFDAELRDGVIGEQALKRRIVRSATGVRSIPSWPVRIGQQLLYKVGLLRYDANVATPLLRARRAVLGPGFVAQPRFLVRVDEFPHYRAWDDPERYGSETFARFHEVMASAGVPYLIAVLPRLSHDPLSPTAQGSRPLRADEVQMLERLAGDGVSFALHGLDHRTRRALPRHRSELCGLDRDDTKRLVQSGLNELAAHGFDSPKVFVAPYNRFDADQLGLLADRFSVVCGGPESIGQLGFQRTPQWRGETVYLPAYAPAYGKAADVLSFVERSPRSAAGLWTPIVLHWGWEADDGWHELERLAARLAGWAAPWGEFLDAVERSRLGDSDRTS